MGAIEYGYVAPDRLNPDIIYGAGRSEVSRYHWSTGQVENVTPIPIRRQYRVERTGPILFSPVTPTQTPFITLPTCSSKQRTMASLGRRSVPTLRASISGIPANLGDKAANDSKADKKRGAIYSLAPSFKSVETLWAGTDDGQVWRTADGGKNWNNITPPELIPWSKATQIAASHFGDETAYVSVSRFRIDDLHPYIYRTHDAGKHGPADHHGLAGRRAGGHGA